MTFETIRYSVENGIALITLDRPEKLNAFTTPMMAELIAAFDRTDEDDRVRCVIVTGAGRAFCAGADLSAGEGTFDYIDDLPEETSIHRDTGGRLVLRIYESVKPVIAAVNGPAVGIGATMQLPMDIRLASTTARYGFVFARRGLVPEAASSWFLPKLVGMQSALEWCYTGRIFDAEEAAAKGLVHSLHAPDDLLLAAMALARGIIDHSAPVSLALTRQMLWRMATADHPMEAHRIDSRAMQARGASADAREGVTAFLEKRSPVFPDRVGEGLADIGLPDSPPFR